MERKQKILNLKEVRDMECKYYSGEEDKCLVGMPVVRIFADLVCTKSPGKCPIFIDIYGYAGNRELAV